MPYDPSLHTTTNKALGIAQANPTDARSYYYDTGTLAYRPFATTAEVLSYLNTAAERTGNFSIYVNTAGVIKEYWFKDGTADGNLVEKLAGASGSAGGDLSGTYPSPTVAKFNGQLPAFYLDRTNHTGTQAATTITEDSTHRFATDAEKAIWNGSVSTGAANIFTAAQTFKVDNIQATSTDGLILTNNTTALGGTPVQYAPRLHFKGTAYQSGAPAGGKAVEFINELQPVTAAVAAGLMIWAASIDGAAFSNQMTLSSAGNLTVTGAITGSNFIEAGTSLRIGTGTTMNNTKNTIVGQNSSGGNVNSTGVGSNTNAGQQSVVLGNDNFGLGATIGNAIVITHSATNVKSANPAIIIANAGYTSANGFNCIFIGRDMNVTASGATNTTNNAGVYIGKSVTHTGAANAGAVIIGRNNDGRNAQFPVLIGSDIATADGLQSAVVLGYTAASIDAQANCVVIGAAAKSYNDSTYGSAGPGGIAIGNLAFSGAWKAIAIGQSAQALAVSSGAFGWGAYSNGQHSYVFGRSAYSDKGNCQVFYTGNVTSQDWYFGGLAGSWTNPTTADVVNFSTALNAGTIFSRLHGISGRDANTSPTLTNTKGGHFRIGGGAGTGTAQGGDIEMAVCLAGGASNNTENAETVMVKVFGATGETQFQSGGTYTSIPCAIVAINSTTKGLLIPRMTKAQRTAIASQVAGLVIYQTDNTPGLRVYNGTNWMRYTETAD